MTTNVRAALFWAAYVMLVAVGIYSSVTDAAEKGTPTPGQTCKLLRAGQDAERFLRDAGCALPVRATCEASCDASLACLRAHDAPLKTSQSWTYTCRNDRQLTISYGPAPITCPSPPAPRQVACPTGSQGSWTQHATVGSAPGCAVSWQPQTPPAGACSPIPPPQSRISLRWSYQPPAGAPSPDGFVIVYWRDGEIARTINVRGPGTREYVIADLVPGTWQTQVYAYQNNAESPRSNQLTTVLR